MTFSPTPIVGSAAWLELLHAEVCWALGEDNIRCLVIKGPTIADWLYPDDYRPSADVDILLDPTRVERAVEVLRGRGFTETYEGTRAGEIGGEHSVNMWRLDPELGQHGIDLHHYFPGIETTPASAFEVLWANRTRATQAGTGVWYPDHAARFVIIALHAAREPNSAKTHEDLARALAEASAPHLDAVAELASRLNCQSALKAGIETQDRAADFIQALALDKVSIPPEWQLRGSPAELTTLRLNRLRQTPASQRPFVLLRLAFPSPALMRIRDPRASEGTWGLTRAYGIRLGQGLRQLPGAMRAVREARRR